MKYAEESFEDASWITMYTGFGIIPQRYDARVDALDENVLRRSMGQIREAIAGAATSAPTQLYRSPLRGCDELAFQASESKLTKRAI